MNPSSNERNIATELVSTGLFFLLSAFAGIIFVGNGYREIDTVSQVLLGGGGAVLLVVGIGGSMRDQIGKFLKKRTTKAFVIAAVIVLSGFFLYKAATGDIKDVTENVPFTASWKAQEPGAIDLQYENNSALALKVDLKGGGDYAELFLDLGSVHFTNIEQNDEGVCNLVGKRLNATIRSDPDFRGSRDHLNGVQFILKDKQWNNSVGPWFDIGPSILTGMEIFYIIPDNSIAKETAAISLKFTIGSGSNETYKGELFLNSMTVNSEMRSNWLYTFIFIVPFVLAIVVFVLMVRHQKLIRNPKPPYREKSLSKHRLRFLNVSR